LFYELPIEQLQNFRERVNAVTVDDIQRVARAYLKPDRLSVVLVGNAAAFESQLNGVGFGKFEQIDLVNLDLTAASFKRDGKAGQEGQEGREGQDGENPFVVQAVRPALIPAAYFPRQQPPPPIVAE